MHKREQAHEYPSPIPGPRTSKFSIGEVPSTGTPSDRCTRTMSCLIRGGWESHHGAEWRKGLGVGGGGRDKNSESYRETKTVSSRCNLLKAIHHLSDTTWIPHHTQIGDPPSGSDPICMHAWISRPGRSTSSTHFPSFFRPFLSYHMQILHHMSHVAAFTHLGVSNSALQSLKCLTN